MQDLIFHKNEREYNRIKADAERTSLLYQNSNVVAVVTLWAHPYDEAGFYGFHFERCGAVEVGQIQKMPDGYYRRIEYIC